MHRTGSIEWECFPKHGDARITTGPISREVLEEISTKDPAPSGARVVALARSVTVPVSVALPEKCPKCGTDLTPPGTVSRIDLCPVTFPIQSFDPDGMQECEGDAKVDYDGRPLLFECSACGEDLTSGKGAA